MHFNYRLIFYFFLCVEINLLRTKTDF